MHRSTGPASDDNDHGRHERSCHVGESGRVGSARHDTVYAGHGLETRSEDSHLHVNGRTIEVLGVEDPAELPCSDRDVELVFECTVVFRREDQLRRHLEVGAGRVVLAAPVKDGAVTSIVPGVNDDDGRGPTWCRRRVAPPTTSRR